MGHSGSTQSFLSWADPPFRSPLRLRVLWSMGVKRVLWANATSVVRLNWRERVYLIKASSQWQRVT